MSDSSSGRETAYSAATAWPAESARVGIVTCLTCGAAVFLSMTVDAMRLHTEWHAGSPPARGTTATTREQAPPDKIGP